MGRFQCILLVLATLLALSYATIARRSDQVRPALSVGLTHNIPYTGNVTVVYDRVFLDTTHSYNSATGTYTIPISGDYVVMMHALAELDDFLKLDLERNDDYVFSAFAHTASQYGSASNVGVVSFEQGDVLKVVGIGPGTLYGLRDEVYCTLSTFLLHARRQH